MLFSEFISAVDRRALDLEFSCLGTPLLRPPTLTPLFRQDRHLRRHTRTHGTYTVLDSAYCSYWIALQFEYFLLVLFRLSLRGDDFQSFNRVETPELRIVIRAESGPARTTRPDTGKNTGQTTYLYKDRR